MSVNWFPIRFVFDVGVLNVEKEIFHFAVDRDITLRWSDAVDHPQARPTAARAHITYADGTTETVDIPWRQHFGLTAAKLRVAATRDLAEAGQNIVRDFIYSFVDTEPENWDPDPTDI